MTTQPLSRPFDVATLAAGGGEVRISASEAERRGIAEWLGILALEALDATVGLWREADGRYGYRATFAADIVQACVVTLDPVPAHLVGEFRRHYRVVPETTRRRAGAGEPSGTSALPADDEETEVVSSFVIDLGPPLIEELSLALDPYPRAPGVVFEAPQEKSAPKDSPFAVLEKLKAKAGGPETGRRDDGKNDG